MTRQALPAPNSTADQVAVRDAQVAHIASRQRYEVPAHLVGKLYSARDLTEPTIMAADRELQAYLDACKARSALKIAAE